MFNLKSRLAPAPANYKELPVQVLAAVGQYGILRYYRNTGDLALLQQCYPAIKSYLLNVWQTNAQGLVISRQSLLHAKNNDPVESQARVCLYLIHRARLVLWEAERVFSLAHIKIILQSKIKVKNLDLSN